MTKKLLSFFAVLLGLLSWSVPAVADEVNWTSDQPVPGGRYYIYNTFAKGFLGNENKITPLPVAWTMNRTDGASSWEENKTWILHDDFGSHFRVQRTGISETTLHAYNFYVYSDGNSYATSDDLKDDFWIKQTSQDGKTAYTLNVYIRIYDALIPSNDRFRDVYVGVLENDKITFSPESSVNNRSYWLFISEDTYKNHHFFYEARALQNMSSGGRVSVTYEPSIAKNDILTQWAQDITFKATLNDGYNFKGWSTTIDGKVIESTSLEYTKAVTSTSHDPFNPTSITLYAIYEKQWTSNTPNAGKNYYLYNIGAGTFMSHGNSYGTQVSLEGQNPRLLCTLEGGTDNLYWVNTHYDPKFQHYNQDVDRYIYCGGDGKMYVNGEAGTSLHIVPCSEGSDQYYIYCTYDEHPGYLVYPNDGTTGLIRVADPDPYGDGAKWKFQQNQNLRFVSYNVDGLPSGGDILGELITINGNCPGDLGTRRMGQMLAGLGADMIGVQEDFNFNDALIQGLGDGYNAGTWKGNFSWASIQNAKLNTDGLNAFWRKSVSVSHESWTDWTSSNGRLSNGFDASLHKGYRTYRMEVKDANGKITYIDVYNLHGDADSDQADINARDAQLEQLANAIKNSSSTRPKIVMGDFNSRYTRENIKAGFIDAIEAEGLFTVNDAWVEYYRQGNYPAYPGKNNWNSNLDLTTGDYNSGSNEVVDKIFYINPTTEGCITLALEGFGVAVDFNYPNDDVWGDKKGKIMGDHYPVIADFTIQGTSELFDVTAKWIWKGETSGTNEWNNKALNNQTYYLHNVGTNRFVQDEDIALTGDVDKAGKIKLDGSGTFHLQHDGGTKDKTYIVFSAWDNLDANKSTYRSSYFNANLNYTLVTNVTEGEDYTNANLIYYDGANDAYLMATGTSEGSSMTKSTQHSQDECKTMPQAKWQFISQTQIDVYKRYVNALQTANDYIKNYKAANPEIAEILDKELNTQGKRWWYQDSVKIFIETVAKLDIANIAISEKANGYSTFVAPYEVTIPEGVKAMKVKAVNGTALLNIEEEYTKTIPANTPVLLSSENDAHNFASTNYYGMSTDDVMTATFSWKTNNLQEDKKKDVIVSADGCDLTGSLKKQPLDAFVPNNNVYLLQNKNGRVAFYLCNPELCSDEKGHYTIGKNRCWLTVADNNGAAIDPMANVKAFYLSIFDMPDTIEDVQVADEGKDTEMYDLSGRRINNPLRGVYIQNGKKVFINK